MGLRSTVRRHPWRFGTLGLLLAAGVAFGLFWFSPWALFVDDRVHEALPTSPATHVAPSPAIVSSPSPGEIPSARSRQTGPQILARGSFRSLEHGSTGRAEILRLFDGSLFLRFEDLKTSNGPDLHVLLTEQPLDTDWHVWDDGAYLDLGGLKGNIGDQNYELPRGTDLHRWKTAVVWCRRFQVGFAVAGLERI